MKSPGLQRSKMLSFYTTIFIPLFFVVTGCSESTVFREHTKIPGYIWDKNNALEFNFVIRDTAAAYNITLDVRHATYYPDDNLLVMLSMISPSGEKAGIPITLPLKDKNGEFNGKGAGDIWDKSIEIFNSMKFPLPGNYKFIIENNQPEPKTVAIMEMGLVVKKVVE